MLLHKLYNVRQGDTMLLIAQWAKMKLDNLLAINPQVANANQIQSGDTVLLPDSVSRTDLLKTAAKAVFGGSGEPAWLQIARREVGQTEKEPGNNQRILEYLATTTLDPASKATDATPWCAAFVNWCLTMGGKTGNGSAWALSWATYGQAVTTPAVGDLVVFSRKAGGTTGGHVGFFLADEGTRVRVLGGNQSNSVSEASYPKNGKLGSMTYSVVAYRRP